MIKTYDAKTPKIAATAFVSELACVIGDVEIGENSSIWPGAVIRGDYASIKIGNNSQIEDNCVVHGWGPLVIGDNVHVGHGAVIHGSRIGRDVLVGINAAILPGAEIGDFCVIAAGSVVAEGMKIPDASFVAGVPAKVKGRTTEAHAARVDDGVKSYIELARKYKEQGL